MPTLAACLIRSVLLLQPFIHHLRIFPQSQLHTSSGTFPYEVLLPIVLNMLSSLGMVLHNAQLLGGIICNVQPRIAAGLISSFSTLNSLLALSFLLVGFS